jgi:hypothetical protein
MQHRDPPRGQPNVLDKGELSLGPDSLFRILPPANLHALASKLELKDFAREICGLYQEALRKLKESPSAWRNLLVERASLTMSVLKRAKEAKLKTDAMEAWAAAFLRVATTIHYLEERQVDEARLLD